MNDDDPPEWQEPADLQPYIERLFRDARRPSGALSWTFLDPSFYDAFTVPTSSVVMMDGRCLGIVTAAHGTGVGEWMVDLLPDPFAGDNP